MGMPCNGARSLDKGKATQSKKDGMKQLKIVTHYFRTDPQFLGDYTSVEIYLDAVKLVEYGDAYHDKGRDKAQGFVDAVTALVGAENINMCHEQVADYE